MDPDPTAIIRAATSFVPGGATITELVLAATGLGEQRGRQLDRIDRTVQRQRDKSFNRALELLDEALKVPGERSPEKVRQAVEKFRDAHVDYMEEPEFSLWAALGVAVLSYALGELDDARYWLPRAHDEAVRAIQTRCATAEHLSISRARISSRPLLAGARGAAVAGAILAGGVVFVLLASVSPGGGIIGGLLAIGIVWALVGVPAAAAKAGEAPAKAAQNLLLKRYKLRLAAARDLAALVDAIYTFAPTLGVDHLPPHRLLANESELRVSYFPADAPKPVRDASRGEH